MASGAGRGEGAGVAGSAEGLALYEVRAQLLKALLRAEFHARRWARRGVWVNASYGLAWRGGAVELELCFHVQAVDNKRWGPEKVLRALRKLAEEHVRAVARKLAEEGVSVQVSEGGGLMWGLGGESLRLVFYVSPISVELGKLLSSKGRRWRVKGDSETWVGGERTSRLKAMEAEALAEVEGVPAPQPEGPEVEEEELRREGWVRVHKAVLKYKVPLAVLELLEREGRLKVLYGSDGSKYVLEEEVKRVAEHVSVDVDTGEGKNEKVEEGKSEKT